MSRNKTEQLNYLIKRRNSGMSDDDYEKELNYLYELGYNNGRNYYIPTMSIR